MEIRNILVNLDVDTKSTATVRCAVDLAGRFGADLIGFAAAEPSPSLIGVDGGVVAAAWYAEERDRIEKAVRAAEEHFRSLVPAGVKCSWRGFVMNPSRGLTEASGRADLIVLSSTLGAKPDHLRRADAGELVLSTGRPVLVTGSGVTAVKGERIVCAWKDTREARRAASDALPFLKSAVDVLAATVDEGDYGPERSSLDDFVAWLVSHGVKARGEVLALDGTAATTIEKAAASLGADLVVSGGYGHSRLREWLLGGVTQDLLAGTGINRLLSN